MGQGFLGQVDAAEHAGNLFDAAFAVELRERADSLTVDRLFLDMQVMDGAAGNLRLMFRTILPNCLAPLIVQATLSFSSAVLDAAEVVQRTVNTVLRIGFGYLAMNDVMRVVKEEQPRVLTQQFDNLCRMTLAIRQSLAGGMIGKLEKIGGVTLEMK